MLPQQKNADKKYFKSEAGEPRYSDMMPGSPSSFSYGIPKAKGTSSWWDSIPWNKDAQGHLLQGLVIQEMGVGGCTRSNVLSQKM